MRSSLHRPLFLAARCSLRGSVPARRSQRTLVRFKMSPSDSRLDSKDTVQTDEEEAKAVYKNVLENFALHLDVGPHLLEGGRSADDLTIRLPTIEWRTLCMASTSSLCPMDRGRWSKSKARHREREREGRVMPGSFCAYQSQQVWPSPPLSPVAGRFQSAAAVTFRGDTSYCRHGQRLTVGQ